MIFGHHVAKIEEKAEKTITALNKMMPNIGGPGSVKRKLLSGAMQSVILYGAPIWGGALGMQEYRGMLTSSQRKSVLRVASAYRTVSAAAIQVICGTIPIDRLHETEEAHLDENRER